MGKCSSVCKCIMRKEEKKKRKEKPQKDSRIGDSAVEEQEKCGFYHQQDDGNDAVMAFCSSGHLYSVRLASIDLLILQAVRTRC